jgi:hypothetical protein
MSAPRPYAKEEAREIFDTADLDGGGTIDFDEFTEVRVTYFSCVTRSLVLLQGSRYKRKRKKRFPTFQLFFIHVNLLRVGR